MTKIDQRGVLREAKQIINDAEKATSKREKLFERYYNFVFGGDQWYEDEKKEKKAHNNSTLVFNASEDYFEEYLSKLFPRNQETGTMEVGVSVSETDKEKREKYEKTILDNYSDSHLPDILLEQGQNFLIGGAACLYYPYDGAGGADIQSIDPTKVYLSWDGRKLNAVAIYDEDEETYLFISEDIIATTDKRVRKIIDLTNNEQEFIPFSWIPQMPEAHTREGRSKIASLWDLDRAYNKAMSDFCDRVEENTIPHRAVFSDSVKEDKISRGRGKTTFLGQDDDMKNLELKEGKEILDYATKIDEKIKTKTGLVDTQGTVKSGLSGLSLSFQYSSLLDKIAFMRIYWDKAFKDLNSAILTYAYGAGDYRTKPVYNSSLMFDSKEKTEEIIAQLKNGLISRYDAIDILRGDVNAQEKLDDIEEEKKKYKQEKNDLQK